MVLATAIADLGVHKMAEDSIEDSELPDCDCDVSRQEIDLHAIDITLHSRLMFTGPESLN